MGDVAVGLDDAAMLLEPEPHIPDIPDVSSIPEDVDIAGDDDVPAFDGVGTPGIASVPGSTAVAGAEAPAVVPPPSYIALDPNIAAGEVAAVEHAVLLLVVGMEIVPAKPVGAGLTPADVISVEPNGIPVGEFAEPIPMPSGEVAPIVGAGSTGSPTCAIAPVLQATSAEKTAAINGSLIVVLHLKSAPSIAEPVNDPERGFAMSTRWPTCCSVAAPVSTGFATSPAGARLFDMVNSWFFGGQCLTPETDGYPTRFAEVQTHQTQMIIALFRLVETVSATKWQALPNRSIKYGFKPLSSGLIDAARIGCEVRAIGGDE